MTNGNAGGSAIYRFARYTAVIVMATGVAVCAGLWWTGELKLDVSKRPAISTVTEIGPKWLERSGVDLDDQLLLVREDVQKLRTEKNLVAAALGAMLSRLAELEFAVGSVEAGETALREVVSLQGQTDAWQVLQAANQLDNLRIIQARPVAEREIWRDACRKQRQAEALHAKGQFLEGIAVAEESLVQRRSLWGDNHAEVAESLLRLAWLCTEHADCYARANDLAKQAVTSMQSAFGKSHPPYGDCQFVLARLADDRGDFDQADRLYEDALVIYKESVGEMSRQYARALCHQGRMHGTWLKEFASAKSMRAEYIRREILDANDPDRAESLEFLAQEQFTSHHFSRAEELLNQAIKIRHVRQGANHPDLAFPKCLLGTCLGMSGDSSKGALFVYDALAKSENARGAKHPIASSQRVLLSKVKEIGMGDYVGAIRELEQALKNWRELGLENHPNFCEAILLQSFNLTHIADRYRDTESPYSDPSWQLYFAALDRTQDAYRAYQSLPRSEQISVTAALKLYFRHYITDFSRIEWSDAQEMLAQAERIVMKHGGVQHPAYLTLLQAQNLSFRWQGKNVEAIKMDEERLNRHLETWGDSDPWEYSGRLGDLTQTLNSDGNHLDGARKTAEEGFKTILNLFQKDGPTQSNSMRSTMLDDCYLFLSFVLSAATAQRDLATVYDHVLLIKGSASSFQLADRLANDHPELAELRKLRDAAHAARQTLKAVAFSENTAGPQWIDRVTKASDAREIAESRLAIETRPIVPAETVVNWKQLQQALPPRTAFIDFLQFRYNGAREIRRGSQLVEPRMVAFITTNSGPPTCVELGPSRPIRVAVSAWRHAIRSYPEKSIDIFNKRNQALAKLIWTPLLEHLKDVERLVIAPDGPLSFVSFAALPGSIAGSYALEDYAIHYTNSGRWLYEQLQDDRNRSLGNGLLLCGDIQYQTEKKPLSQTSFDLLRNVADINNLPASGPEIDVVRELFIKSFGDQIPTETLKKFKATEAQFRAALERNWNCIHFAGHGLFIPPERAGELTGKSQVVAGSNLNGLSSYFVERNQLLLSGLVLASSSPHDKKPGFLTAEDLGSFDLRQTDLVVLSACETGLGCTAGGDGVLGLTRAFLTAGARSVVSSLWKVEDAATSLLMHEFYQNLWEKRLPKSEALRQAQLSVLRDASLIQTQRDNLIAQLRRSLPELSDDELMQELAQVDRGLVPGLTEEIGEFEDEQIAEPQHDSTKSTRTHPALWAAFILNGDAR